MRAFVCEKEKYKDKKKRIERGCRNILFYLESRNLISFGTYSIFDSQ